MFVTKIHYNKKLIIKCPVCGYEGKPKREIPGSIRLELLLWICFFIPGLLYSLWRLTQIGYCKCPKCKNNMLTIKKSN